MVLAAKFGALATVNARFVNACPDLVDKTRNGVFFNGKGRHPPGMDHVICSDHETHLLADRQHQRVIHFEQVIPALGGLVLDLFARG